MTVVSNPPTVASIAARLERLPTSRWHVKVRTFIGVVTFFEAFDQLLIATALPVLIREWGLSTGQVTLAITSGSVGMLVGALAAGWLADRVGRVRMVMCGVLVTGLTSLAIVFAPGFAWLVVLRFVQGLGIGGEVPVAATYVSEITKARHRGRFVLLYELFFPAGLLMATVVAAWVVPNWGWRAMFAIGAAPALLMVFLQRRVPESPRWLAAKGRLPEADEVLTKIEAEVSRTKGELPPPAPDPVAVDGRPRSTLADLFTGIYLRRTIVVSALWFFGYFVNYGITAWLPTLYTSVFGLDLDTALKYNLCTNAVGFLGCVVAALTIDQIGRRVALTAGLAGSAVSLGTLAVLGASSGSQVLLWSSLAAFFIFATNVTLYLYTPELFPTRSRALGCSTGGVFNRLGVILGPIVVGRIIAHGGTNATVFGALGAAALLGALFALLATETRGKTLEQLAPGGHNPA
ncbi:putative MFS transporter [Actinomadura hallensis]|uniref:Putative MFS transporter n=1 Tax=Actinomadura hallensis TaxID=337895 RepID=A0A543IGR9_9ACTN|nr:MFS transporter [Actinomadura hallensis]TQM69737.1 putative MFS transporter [Actinomadura hallensis]